MPSPDECKNLFISAQFLRTYIEYRGSEVNSGIVLKTLSQPFPVDGIKVLFGIQRNIERCTEAEAARNEMLECMKKHIKQVIGMVESPYFNLRAASSEAEKLRFCMSEAAVILFKCGIVKELSVQLDMKSVREEECDDRSSLIPSVLCPAALGNHDFPAAQEFFLCLGIYILIAARAHGFLAVQRPRHNALYHDGRYVFLVKTSVKLRKVKRRKGLNKASFHG